MVSEFHANGSRGRTQRRGCNQGLLVTPQAVPGQSGQTHLSELTALVKTRLKRMQYRPGLLDSFLAGYRPGPHTLR